MRNIERAKAYLRALLKDTILEIIDLNLFDET